MSLALEKSDRNLSGADGSPLSVLGKSKVLLENKMKFAKTTVYVIKGLQCNLLGLSELRKLGILAVENIVCKIEVMSIPSSVTTGELSTDCKAFASAPAQSAIPTTCSSMANCRDISRHNLQCLPVPAEAKKIKIKKGRDDPDCNLWHLVREERQSLEL